jgi:hypothetical protein
MMALTNPLWGRLIFLGCGIAVFAVGGLLVVSTTVARDDDDSHDVDSGEDIAGRLTV